MHFLFQLHSHLHYHSHFNFNFGLKNYCNIINIIFYLHFFSQRIAVFIHPWMLNYLSIIIIIIYYYINKKKRIKFFFFFNKLNKILYLL